MKLLTISLNVLLLRQPQVDWWDFLSVCFSSSLSVHGQVIPSNPCSCTGTNSAHSCVINYHCRSHKCLTKMPQTCPLVLMLNPRTPTLLPKKLLNVWHSTVGQFPTILNNLSDASCYILQRGGNVHKLRYSWGYCIVNCLVMQSSKFILMRAWFL